MELNLKFLMLQNRMSKQKEEIRWFKNLTSTVSHEMRTPLEVIIQTAQRISRIIEKDKQQNKLTSMIFYQAQLMLCFVNDLIDLKQIKNGVF